MDSAREPIRARMGIDADAATPRRPASRSSPVAVARGPGHKPAFRAAAAVLALVASTAGGWLALHYPIATPAMPVAFAAFTLLAGLFPSAWLALIPALLPVIGFAPYSGWITFEEFDLLVLAVAAGGYARLGLGLMQRKRTAPGQTNSRQRHGSRRSSVSVLVWLLLLSFGTALLIAMQRGFTDAGGFDFGWFQGYLQPMNSVRIGKSFLLATLLLPLLWVCTRESAANGRTPPAGRPERGVACWRRSQRFGNAWRLPVCSISPATTARPACSGRCMSAARHSTGFWR